jgi:hypothetical protein
VDPPTLIGVALVLGAALLAEHPGPLRLLWARERTTTSMEVSLMATTEDTLPANSSSSSQTVAVVDDTDVVLTASDLSQVTTELLRMSIDFTAALARDGVENDESAFFRIDAARRLMDLSSLLMERARRG